MNKKETFKATSEFKDEAHFSSFNQYKNVYDFSVLIYGEKLNMGKDLNQNGFLEGKQM